MEYFLVATDKEHNNIEWSWCIIGFNPINPMAEKSLGSPTSKNNHNCKAKSIYKKINFFFFFYIFAFHWKTLFFLSPIGIVFLS